MTNIFAKMKPAFVLLAILTLSGCGGDPQGFDAESAYDLEGMKQELVFRYQGMIAQGKVSKARTAVPKKSFEAPERRESGADETKAAPDETPADLVKEMLSKAGAIPGQTPETLKNELAAFVKSTDKIPADQKAPLLEALGTP